MAPASLSPTYILIPAFSQHLTVLTCLMRRETVLSTNVRNGCGGLRDLAAGQRKRHDRKSQQHSRLYWMVLEQGCMRGEVPHSVRPSTGLRHGGYHQKGRRSREHPGERKVGKGAYVPRWCHSRAQCGVSESESSKGP